MEGYGFIDSTLTSFINRNIEYYSEGMAVNDLDLYSHASIVGIIACGNNGIANNSNIFSADLSFGIIDCLDWFTSKDIHIINCSFASDDYNKYSSFA